MPIRAVPSDFIGFARRKALNSMGLKGLGGEGGIRTPDSLATMSDFESGAFNRALPPLRVCFQPFTASCLPSKLSGTGFSPGSRSTAFMKCSGARCA